MFTRFELGILHEALLHYKGIYGYSEYDKLNNDEIKKHEKSLETAKHLAERFEGILYDYYAMETANAQST